MKRIGSRLLAASALAATFVNGATFGQCKYTVRLLDLPPHPQCPNTPPSFNGTSINNHGEVAGEFLICSGTHKACWWNASGQFLPIAVQGQSEGEANAISDTGVITGDALVGSDYKWFVTVRGTSTLIVPPCSYLLAKGVAACVDGNLFGSVYCLDELPINRSYGLTPDGAFIDVWADITTSDDTFTADARDGGLVVGKLVQGEGGNDTRAFRWWNGAVDVLGPVPGGYTSFATAVNRWGDVVGAGKYDLPNWRRGDPPRGFLYVNGRMIDLGFFGPNDNASGAIDINDLGQVVGTSSVWWYGPNTNIFWQHGQMTKVGDLVDDPHLSSSVTGVRLNDRGDILAKGYYDGDLRLLVLEPIREHAGDVDLDGKVGAFDLELVIRAWASTYDYDHGPGDANNDRVVDVRDIACVLGDWDGQR